MRYYHTIENGIVQDALFTITQHPLPESYIGGGLSLQFTLPKDLHRKTSDIDLTTSRYTNSQDFRDYVLHAFEELIHRGYKIEFTKRRSTLDAHLERDENHLMVQLPRRNKQNFDGRKTILEREVSNARKIPYGELSISVITYEDLVAHKIIRSSSFLESYKLRVPTVTNLEQIKEELNILKEDFRKVSYALEPDEAARKLAEIRLVADVFDTTAIFKYFAAEFDENYFYEALHSFNGSQKRFRTWQELIEKLRP